MTLNLFDPSPTFGRDRLGEQAFVLRGFALDYVPELVPALEAVERAAPFRHMITPGGFTMSVALTNCGPLGWVTDRTGYRYSPNDPETGRPWPAMPDPFLRLAREAAADAGFADFAPDACLINRYVPGARLTLHQDKDEHDFSAPIVSVSLGIPAVFQFGGQERSDKTLRTTLLHGDVVVWGGVDRLRFHGVMPLKEAEHPLFGARRINITFRRAGR